MQKSVHCAPFGMVGPAALSAAPDVARCGAAGEAVGGSLPDLFDAHAVFNSAANSAARMNGRPSFFIGRYLTVGTTGGNDGPSRPGAVILADSTSAAPGPRTEAPSVAHSRRRRDRSS